MSVNNQYSYPENRSMVQPRQGSRRDMSTRAGQNAAQFGDPGIDGLRLPSAQRMPSDAPQIPSDAPPVPLLPSMAASPAMDTPSTVQSPVYTWS